VFPFFLWIVGVALTLSTAKRVERGESRTGLLKHAFRRAFIIFALGFFLSPLPDFHWETARIPGVLQRIAVCYLIATLVFLYTSIRGQVAWLAGLCIVYWMLMTLYPVPGYGPGVLEPIGNFAQYIDNMLLSGHMWRATKVWDPEGIVSTLPAIATVLFGILAGHLLRSRLTPSEKTSWFAVGGLLTMAAAQILSIWMPINKSLWTVPFAVWMAGLAAAVFACWYWITDIQGWGPAWLKPFEWMGMNAILLYVLSGVVAKVFSRVHVGEKTLQGWLHADFYGSFLGPFNASLGYALTNVFLIGVIGWLLHTRRWYLRF
jgi:predicted acyltransferase